MYGRMRVDGVWRWTEQAVVAVRSLTLLYGVLGSY